ncbi:MAG: PIN domain-containing protein [Actinomycetia bacterium]|nr:PIN domain-containing protein [Actinomycetes bacterium]
MSVIYLDTSALLRACLTGAPDHVAALALLATPPVDLVSSELLWLEADRAAIRLAGEDTALAELPQVVTRALARVAMMPLDHYIVDAARRIPQTVKSLDAIHIASAESLRESLDCVVTYDKRMAAVLAARGVSARTAAQVRPGNE